LLDARERFDVPGGAGLDFDDVAEAALDGAARLVRHEVQITRGGHIPGEGDAIARLAAQELVDGDAERLAHQVMQGDVHAGGVDA
jgi:hypothetical protein